MAAVNFSVPDDVKAEFDKAFGDQDGNSIISDLMRRAVREHELRIRRAWILRELGSARACRLTFGSDEIAKGRESGHR